jgi:hypothetical protein
MADLTQVEAKVVEARDWMPLLDRELSLLPGKYRSAIILCDLDGRTRKEASCQLGLKEGTLSSRLATARRMLATRLSKYGLTISGGVLAASLAKSSVSAKVPASLIWSTAKAARLVAAGQFAGVSVSAVSLMKGTAGHNHAEEKLIAGKGRGSTLASSCPCTKVLTWSSEKGPGGSDDAMTCWPTSLPPPIPLYCASEDMYGPNRMQVTAWETASDEGVAFCQADPQKIRKTWS